MLLMRPYVLRSYVNIELLLELLANAPTFELANAFARAGRPADKAKETRLAASYLYYTRLPCRY